MGQVSIRVSRNRYYNPEAAQFTQEDPIGLAGGMNLYGFAGGDPVNFSDPFGLCPPKDDNHFDCEGSAFYADRIMTGRGNKLLNAVGFTLAACGEEERCFNAIGAAAGGGLSTEEAGSSFNPFKGKSAADIDGMMIRKGFSPRGPDPVSGKGGYVNPRTGRSYHIDEANSYGEPPHVDINQPRDYNGPKPKRKMDMK